MIRRVNNDGQRVVEFWSGGNHYVVIESRAGEVPSQPIRNDYCDESGVSLQDIPSSSCNAMQHATCDAPGGRMLPSVSILLGEGWCAFVPVFAVLAALLLAVLLL